MGYCIHMRESKFNVNNKNFPAIVEAVKALLSHPKLTKSHFDWVDTKNLHDATEKKPAIIAMISIFEEWRYSIDFDEQGNVKSIDFFGEKMGDDMIFFNAIAPFVEDGSYLEMRGEDDDLWRWVFQNGKVIEKRPKIEWGE